MQDRYYLNNMSDAEITIPLSAKRVIKPHTSLPLNNKDVAIFKEMKSKRKDRISRFDALRLSKIPLDRDSNYAKAEPAKVEEKVETEIVETEVKTVEVKKASKKQEDKPEPKAVETKDEKSEIVETAVEDKPEPKAEEAKEDKKEASTKDKEEEAARKALEAKVNEQFI